MTSNLDEVPAVMAEIFCMISMEIQQFNEKEREKNLKKKGRRHG